MTPWGETRRAGLAYSLISTSSPTLERLLWNSLPNPLSLWHIIFKGTSLLCPPLPGKAIKLFFSTSPQTVSEIQLGSSAEILAISVNLFGLPMSHFISSKWGTFTSLFLPFENGDYTGTYLNTVLKIKWCIKVLGTDTFLKCGGYHINIY